MQYSHDCFKFSRTGKILLGLQLINMWVFGLAIGVGVGKGDAGAYELLLFLFAIILVKVIFNTIRKEFELFMLEKILFARITLSEESEVETTHSQQIIKNKIF